MLAQKEALEVLKSYNINSQKYEPTIYKTKNQIGICMDIKDSYFGYLTRAFLMNTKEELDDFLKSYFWYKENYTKYNIKLTLSSYTEKSPKIVYRYKNEPIKTTDMLNIEQFQEKENKEKEEIQKKEYYLKSIEELTNYLIQFKQMKENIKKEKNTLKTEENDLKFELLTELTIYYGKELHQTKKQITLDPPTNIDTSILTENLKNIKDKSLPEIIQYLTTLINGIKEEEQEEKNLVNIYSNSVYQYNINILKKQIEFVKSKIKAEKNFSLKGSKIHNIDEELKSFLKTNIAPAKIEIFLEENKTKINQKFNKITIENACEQITGKTITEQESKKEIIDYKNPLDELKNQFNNLPEKTQINLILYTSIYKSICNYIINHNYPNIEDIEAHFDFDYYYKDIEEIVYSENNSHYLVHYFKEIDFKDLPSYINSITDICKDLEQINFNITSPITRFSKENQNKYKELTSLPTKNSKYMISTQNIIYIPEKLEFDFEQLEITAKETESYYTKEKIIEELETITLSKFNKQQITKDGIIITTDLILTDTITLNKSHLEGENI